jgi:hypothetical protein
MSREPGHTPGARGLAQLARRSARQRQQYTRQYNHQQGAQHPVDDQAHQRTAIPCNRRRWRRCGIWWCQFGAEGSDRGVERRTVSQNGRPWKSCLYACAIPTRCACCPLIKASGVLPSTRTNDRGLQGFWGVRKPLHPDIVVVHTDCVVTAAVQGVLAGRSIGMCACDCLAGADQGRRTPAGPGTACARAGWLSGQIHLVARGRPVPSG